MGERRDKMLTTALQPKYNEQQRSYETKWKRFANKSRVGTLNDAKRWKHRPEHFRTNETLLDWGESSKRFGKFYLEIRWMLLYYPPMSTRCDSFQCKKEMISSCFAQNSGIFIHAVCSIHWRKNRRRLAEMSPNKFLATELDTQNF